MSNSSGLRSIYGKLPNDWGLSSIGELVNSGIAELQTGPFGTALLASEYVQDGTPVIAVKDIGVNRLFIDDNTPRVAESTRQRLKRYTLLEDDIVFGRKGAVDRRAIVSRQQQGWLQGSDCIRLRFLSEQLNPKFVSYMLGSRQCVSWIMQNAGGSTMPSLNQNIISMIQVPLPPLAEQQAITEILSSLDDKIELNRRMNETLEETARAIFKSWFVDFDPVHAKARGEMPIGMDAETAALFPDSFEESDLGLIPRGWRTGVIRNDFNIIMGQSPPGDTYNEIGEGIPFYQGRRDFGFRYPSLRIFCTTPTRIAQAGDTLISVRAPVGDVNLALDKCCIGRGVAAVRHKSGSRSYTLYSMFALSTLFQNFDGEGTVFGSISGKDFENIRCVLPPPIFVQAFEAIAYSIDQQIENNEEQIRTLTETRDALLPKLVSGEIRVG